LAALDALILTRRHASRFLSALLCLGAGRGGWRGRLCASLAATVLIPAAAVLIPPTAVLLAAATAFGAGAAPA
jgi:hypothetical protein